MNLERILLERINTAKRRGKMGVVRRRQLKIITFQRAMTKKVVSFFHEKLIKVTPSVAAPSDTNPSDATELYHFSGHKQSVMDTCNSRHLPDLRARLKIMIDSAITDNNSTSSRPTLYRQHV